MKGVAYSVQNRGGEWEANCEGWLVGGGPLLASAICVRTAPLPELLWFSVFVLWELPKPHQWALS